MKNKQILFFLFTIASVTIFSASTCFSFSFEVEHLILNATTNDDNDILYESTDGPLTYNDVFSTWMFGDGYGWSPYGVATLTNTETGPLINTPDANGNDDSMHGSMMCLDSYEYAVDFKKFSGVDNTTYIQGFGLNAGKSGMPIGTAPWITATWVTGVVNGENYTNALVLNYGHFDMATQNDNLYEETALTGLNPSMVIGLRWTISADKLNIKYYYRVNMGAWQEIHSAILPADQATGISCAGAEIEVENNPLPISNFPWPITAVIVPADSDGDGMDDATELSKWGTLLYDKAPTNGANVAVRSLLLD